MTDNDNYIIQQKKETKSNYRILFEKIVKSSPSKVKDIGKIDDAGNFTFSIELTKLGIKKEDLSLYRQELFCPFSANFIGELLIRDNFDQFVSLLTTYSEEEYSEMVCKCIHKTFGMRFLNDKIIFTFHISLLQKILNEDIKNNLCKTV